jgi:hypothetical protein
MYRTTPLTSGTTAGSSNVSLANPVPSSGTPQTVPDNVTTPIRHRSINSEGL